MPLTIKEYYQAPAKELARVEELKSVLEHRYNGLGFTMWFSTRNGALIWDAKTKPFIERTNLGKTAKDSDDSTSFMDFFYNPVTRIGWLNGFVKFKKVKRKSITGTYGGNPVLFKFKNFLGTSLHQVIRCAGTIAGKPAHFQLWGDGSFTFVHTKEVLKDKLFNGEEPMLVNVTFPVTLAGLLSFTSAKLPSDICSKAVNWGIKKVGKFKYKTAGTARLDMTNDEDSGYPYTDCSSLLWNMFWFGANIPIGAANPPGETFLGKYVTSAMGGYRSGDIYYKGEPLDISVMQPGDLVLVQNRSYGNPGTGAAKIDPEGEKTAFVCGGEDFPPSWTARDIVYRDTNEEWKLEVENFQEPDFSSFNHAAVYIGNNRFLHITGMPLGYYSNRGATKVNFGASGLFGSYYNDWLYPSGNGGETISRIKPDGYEPPSGYTENQFNPVLGPWIMEGMDVYKKDVISATNITKNKCDPRYIIFSGNRLVVRMFPDATD